MNNKILSVVLVAGIATTGFAAISSADDSSSGTLLWQRSEIRELFEKVKNGEELTSEEQETLDEAKENFKERGGIRWHMKRAGFKMLSDEEKQSLESMTDEEKKAFFEEKKAEMQAQREAHKAVIDKLIVGESLSADEEALRLEMLAKFEDENNDHPIRRGNGDIIAKLLAGDELTSDEETQLTEMQEKRAEREAQRELMQPIFEKMKNGEELTEEQQALVDERKSEMKEKFRERLR